MTPVPPPTYTVTFNVRSNTGTAITNAVVTFNGVTNPAGNYTFTGVLAGTYSYSVSASGYNNLTNETLTITGNRTVNTVMSIKTTYSISFSVLSIIDNSIIQNAVVKVGAVLNSAGNYYFENFAPGTYSYTVTSNGYQSFNGVITIDNKDTQLTIKLTPQVQQKVSIVLESDPPGFAFVSGAGTYTVSDQVTISATPADDDFLFTGWMENNRIVSRQNELDFIASNNRQMVAKFEYSPREFEISATVSESDAGAISGTGFYLKGNLVLLEYHGSSDFKFKGWVNPSGQIVSRQNPFEFEVIRDLKLVAMVEKLHNSDDMRIAVHPNPSNGMLRITNARNIETELLVYNSQGYVAQMRRIPAMGNSLDLRELPPGMYLLQFTYGDETVVRKVLIK